jgi:hypothetical protein
LATLEFAPAIINLRQSVVERLSREVRRAFESTTPGMEIGGLLLGTAIRQTRVIEIEDFEPLLCESVRHRFVLSESNWRAIEKTLAACGSTSNGRLNVVGCYRSHIGELRLSAHDLLFAQRCFQAPAGVFLMIKPPSGQALTGAFCSWENAFIDFGYTVQEFSFDARQLAATSDEPCGANASAHTEATQRTRALGGLSTLLWRAPTQPWRVRTLNALWYSSALLMIVVVVLAYRVYLNFGGARASGKDQVISLRARPLNVRGSQSEVPAKSMAPSKHTSSSPSPGASGQAAAPLKRLSASGSRARRGPRFSIGREPPFTCSVGDVFRKIDAAAGWDTFTCRGNNVWSITRR